jgi:methylenetetrahydrofolate reductase (NADPH)
MKFVDKINKCVADGKPFFSFEYFPPKTEEGLSNLYLRFDRMGALGPVRVGLLFSWAVLNARKTRSFARDVSPTSLLWRNCCTMCYNSSYHNIFSVFGNF